MSTKLLLDRFTNQSQKVSGTLIPASLARLKPFLANPNDAKALLEGVDEAKKAGEIRYSLSGHVTADAAGRRTRRVKCIILGWFLLSDPKTFEPEPYEVSIESILVLVNSESDLPPLHEEAENEDYVVLGEELDVEELVEEEILLDLPFWAIANDSTKAKEKPSKGTKSDPRTKQKSTKQPAEIIFEEVGEAPKLSPFAQLAKLKKSN